MRFVTTCILTVSLFFQGGLAPLAQSDGAVIGKVSGAFFALSVADVAKLSRWYQEKLGFRALSQGESPNKIAKFAILEGAGTIIELIRTARPSCAAASRPRPPTRT